MSPNAEKKCFTYADYCQWPDDERWEIIDGTPVAMCPAPATVHQLISGALFYQIYRFLTDKPCRVIAAPFDVRLPDAAEGETKNVVQPDISVICDPEKIDDRGCIGAPDMIVEILSPSTASRDSIRKLRLYEKYGVREYWLIQPEYRLLTVYLLGENGRFSAPVSFDEAAVVSVRTLPELKINLAEVFECLDSQATQNSSG